MSRWRIHLFIPLHCTLTIYHAKWRDVILHPDIPSAPCENCEHWATPIRGTLTLFWLHSLTDQRYQTDEAMFISSKCVLNVEFCRNMFTLDDRCSNRKKRATFDPVPRTWHKGESLLFRYTETCPIALIRFAELPHFLGPACRVFPNLVYAGP